MKRVGMLEAETRFGPEQASDSGAAAEQPAGFVRRLLGAFACDTPILLLLAVYAAFTVPLLCRSTSNPQYLATFNDDDPLITQQLVGMTVPPYGNPANFLQHSQRRPAYWDTLAWPGELYYGGTYLDAGFLLFAPLQLLGCADFPAAPICLRIVSCLAGALCLVVLYNLGRRLGSRWIGAAAVVMFLGDPWFTWYSTIIHPDMLMTALGILALWVAVLHVERADLASLVAFGVLVGFVQGAKAGGPWLLPLGLTAVVWSHLRRRQAQPRRWQALAARLCLLGLVAFLAFAASTPYAFVNSYFFRAIRDAYRYNRSLPYGDHPFRTWVEGVWRYDSPLLHALAGLGIVLGCLHCLRHCLRRASRDREYRPVLPVLAAVLGASVFFWYASTVRLFLSLNYLLTLFAILALLAAYGAGRSILWLQQRCGFRAWAVNVTAALLLITLAVARIHVPLRYTLTELCRAHTTYVAIGRWAEENLPHDARIMYYGHAYFDPAVLPNAHWGSNGLVMYPAIEKANPDYFVLDSSVYDAPHIAELRKTQHYVRGREGNESVLFLQDVLDRGTPEAELVMVFRPSRIAGGRIAYLKALARLALGLDQYLLGPEVRLYRYHRHARVSPDALSL